LPVIGKKLLQIKPQTNKKKIQAKKNNLSLKITETSFIKPILKADFIIVISWTFT